MTSMLEALKRIEALAPEGRSAERRFPAARDPVQALEDADAALEDAEAALEEARAAAEDPDPVQEPATVEQPPPPALKQPVPPLVKQPVPPLVKQPVPPAVEQPVLAVDEQAIPRAVERTPPAERIEAGLDGEWNLAEWLAQPVADHDRPYRDAAINILSQLDAGRASALLFVASTVGEGNTAAVARLASVLAGRQGEVLAVDVDLAAPRLAEELGITSDRGLGDVLWGPASWPDVVRPCGIEGLAVLPGLPPLGRMAAKPDPLQIARLLDQLRCRYRLVLLDAGRMRPEETVLWARFCEAAYLLVAVGDTSARAARGAAEVLMRGGGRLMGSLLMQKGAKSLR